MAGKRAGFGADKRWINMGTAILAVVLPGGAMVLRDDPDLDAWFAGLVLWLGVGMLAAVVLRFAVWPRVVDWLDERRPPDVELLEKDMEGGTSLIRIDGDHGERLRNYGEKGQRLHRELTKPVMSLRERIALEVDQRRGVEPLPEMVPVPRERPVRHPDRPYDLGRNGDRR